MTTRNLRRRILPSWLILAACQSTASLAANTPEAIADVHIHYKWSQQDVTSAAEAAAALRANNIELAVITGTPAELALQVTELAPERVVPIYGVYRGGRDWNNWQFRPQLVNEVREALQSGRYHGIGELHLIGGYATRWRENRVLQGLLELGAEFKAPLLIHTEFSTAGYMLDICRNHPHTPVLWAHAGAILSPQRVAEVMRACPNLNAELAARDPWRYTRNPIADTDGRLLPEWRQLVLEFQDRFMIGSDPVWPVERLDAWDTPDTGWQEMPRFLEFHRRWIADLPAAVQGKLLRDNARRLFAGALAP